MLAIDLDIGDIILEDSGDIDLQIISAVIIQPSLIKVEDRSRWGLGIGEVGRSGETLEWKLAVEAKIILQERYPWRRRCEKEVIS